ncbi:MAG TPA: GNAT family protein [Pilimelia sp.]|nr:GNAT family protein [Pilimelia sp.]
MLPVEIPAAGLLMRPWRVADAPAVAAALADPAIALWNPSSAAIDLDGALDWVARRADWSDGSHASFAITEDRGGPLLGSVSLHRINWQMQDAAIGYWTVRAARGRGIAGRAVDAVTTWAFEALDLHRVELCHAVANAASCRVAAKAGFPLEGTLREAYRYGDGQRYDEHLHARLATDPAPLLAPGMPSGAGRRGR